MSLNRFLEPCPNTAVVIPLSEEVRHRLKDISAGEVVLFSANAAAGEDNHLVARVLAIDAEGLTASAAAYVGARHPGPEPAPVERRYGLRTFQSTPSGGVYSGNAALDLLDGQVATRPYADELRRSGGETTKL